MHKAEHRMKIKTASKYLMVSSIITLIAFSLTSTSLNAQTEPMYSQYMYNMLGVNPAYAGNREALSMNFFQRNQWVGINLILPINQCRYFRFLHHEHKIQKDTPSKQVALKKNL